MLFQLISWIAVTVFAFSVYLVLRRIRKESEKKR